MLVMARGAAPDRLELVREFVNTYERELDDDRLRTTDGAASWLEEQGLAGGDGAISEPDRERLVAVREALRELLLANNAGERPPQPALDVLNEQASESAVGLRFDAEGSALVTRCTGIDAAIADLLSVVHAAMADETWRRLKVCGADDCRWAFYDRSRNRSGTWCEMDDCGNRAKARAYRQRRRRQAKR